MPLFRFRDDFNKVLTAMSDTYGVDAAIFDLDSKLIASTPSYLEHKGHTVHAPSIQEVITNKNVVVNEPGLMKSCAGCRFKDNCPSTIEILNSIYVKDEVVGVITLTSFSKEGHDRISDNTSVYIDLLNLFTELISSIILQTYKISQEDTFENRLRNILDLSSDGILTIDPMGIITHINPTGFELFSFYKLCTKSIYQILPEAMVKQILSGISYKNKSTRFSNFSANVSTAIIENGTELRGYVIYIHAKNNLIPTKKPKIKEETKISFNSVKGSSKLINSTIDKCKKLSNSSSTILITGETGTGKGLLANAIHNESMYSSGPFVAVNCTSIPESLFESELFGYEEGAFTGAKRGGKPGKFELACGGTIFLDEIGELPFHMQAKLLTVLQGRSIERVGGITSIPINVRVIAATNKDLYEMVESKSFRSDLYYRLNVISLELPPLRMRKSDVNELSHEFLKEYNQKLGKNILGFTDEAIEILMNYNWPGNIREVQNVIEYAVNFEDFDNIQTQNLPERLLINNLLKIENSTLNSKDIELDLIISKLNIYGWDGEGKKKAACDLGIGVRTLYRRLENHEQPN